MEQNTAQHSTARHSTAQHSTAQHSLAQHSAAHTSHGYTIHPKEQLIQRATTARRAALQTSRIAQGRLVQRIDRNAGAGTAGRRIAAGRYRHGAAQQTGRHTVWHPCDASGIGSSQTVRCSPWASVPCISRDSSQPSCVAIRLCTVAVKLYTVWQSHQALQSPGCAA
jgi:hypothetical protein